jgi:DNA-binding CsgD family transcriptional regulator
MLAEADRFRIEGEGVRLYRALYVLPFLVATGDAEAPEVWALSRARYRSSTPDGSAGQAYAPGVELLSFQGRFDDAAALLREGWDIVAQTDGLLPSISLVRAGAWPLAELAIAARATGDRDSAAAHESAIEGLIVAIAGLRSSVGAGDERLARVLGLVEEQIRAELARATGEPAAERWSEIAAGWAEVEQPYRALYARWRHAEALEAAGDRAAAATVLREAHAAAERLGARPLVGQLETVARRMRVRLGIRDVSPDAESVSAPFGLTPREQEVLTRVALGRTNRQIAGELFISESTAGVHVSNILSKLGVATRTEAARVALSQGLVEA